MTAAQRIDTYERLRGSRAVQQQWSATKIRDRLKVIRRFRHLLAANCEELAASVSRLQDETLISEVLPLADACRFLERNAERILAPQRPGRSGRPFWLWGVEVEIRREPCGVVLVIGPANYPLFLPGVQVLQALAAGNAVYVK